MVIVTLIKLEVRTLCLGAVFRNYLLASSTELLRSGGDFARNVNSQKISQELDNFAEAKITDCIVKMKVFHQILLVFESNVRLYLR